MDGVSRFAVAVDRGLARFAQGLKDGESRKRLVTRVSHWCRALLVSSTWLYALGVVVILAALRWIGERNLTLAFLLYVPRQILLVPLAFLLLPSLFFHWRLALLQLLGAAVFIFYGMGYELQPWRTSPRRDGLQRITILTYNRGQHMNQSLQPFKELVRPDIIALQESPGRADGYARANSYQEFPYTKQEGEFTILSRFPVVRSSLLAFPFAGRPTAVAARFEIDFNGSLIACFNVHMPTPRDTLNYYRRGAFLYGAVGLSGSGLAEKKKANQEYWDQRIKLVQYLLSAIEAERIPCIVVGDFNAPAGGHIDGLLSDKLQDAHRKVGNGFGYTFPGTTKNPLSLGGPWMRIDYIFADEAWRLHSCLTESRRSSQHRALAATMELNSGN